MSTSSSETGRASSNSMRCGSPGTVCAVIRSSTGPGSSRSRGSVTSSTRPTRPANTRYLKRASMIVVPGRILTHTSSSTSRLAAAPSAAPASGQRMARRSVGPNWATSLPRSALPLGAAASRGKLDRRGVGRYAELEHRAGQRRNRQVEARGRHIGLHQGLEIDLQPVMVGCQRPQQQLIAFVVPLQRDLAALEPRRHDRAASAGPFQRQPNRAASLQYLQVVRGLQSCRRQPRRHRVTGQRSFVRAARDQPAFGPARGRGRLTQQLAVQLGWHVQLVAQRLALCVDRHDHAVNRCRLRLLGRSHVAGLLPDGRHRHRSLPGRGGLARRRPGTFLGRARSGRGAARHVGGLGRARLGPDSPRTGQHDHQQSRDHGAAALERCRDEPCERSLTGGGAGRVQRVTPTTSVNTPARNTALASGK